MILEKIILGASALLWGAIRVQRPEKAIPDPVLFVPTLPPLPDDSPASEPGKARKRKALERMAPLGYSSRPEDLEPNDAAKLFIKWAQQGEAGKVFTAKEIDDLWDIFTENININDIPYQTIRSELGALGLCLGRKQLAIEYRDIKRRTGQSRAVLYAIPLKGRTISRQSGPNPDIVREGGGQSGPNLSGGYRPSGVRPARGDGPSETEAGSKPDTRLGTQGRAVA